MFHFIERHLMKHIIYIIYTIPYRQIPSHTFIDPTPSRTYHDLSAFYRKRAQDPGAILLQKSRYRRRRRRRRRLRHSSDINPQQSNLLNAAIQN